MYTVHITVKYNERKTIQSMVGTSITFILQNNVYKTRYLKYPQLHNFLQCK